MSPHRRPVPLWYALLAVLLSVLAVSGGSIAYTSWSADRADRRWCSLITTMDEAYSVTPPTTEIGRKLARDIRALRGQFDCP